MAYKDVKHYIYLELKKRGYDLKTNYHQLSYSQLHDLKEVAKKFNYRYKGSKPYTYAFWNSMQTYYSKNINKRES